ncbi:MAG: DUF1615 domain-containing protein [Gammaproteobacteria bacterium]|nr:DUF1615 domain-containing protein [Gammaproteobacteria bacterium]
MRPLRIAGAGLLAAALLLAGACIREKPRTPEDVRAELLHLLPPEARDRTGWAGDIQSAFAALEIEPSTQNLCATLAVIAQESSFVADPPVAGLDRIARQEIERRATARGIPLFVVRSALQIQSRDGRTYDQRLAGVRTEHDLSRLFDEMIARVPMGPRLLAGVNPVRTGGPMQVSMAFAQQHARARKYPYPMTAGIREEVFSRRGGLYFGIAHLLGYPASYEQPLYRFADFNAGMYASRNAAFQAAVGRAAGREVPRDGDLLLHGARRDGDRVGSTEDAVRSLAPLLDMSHDQIRGALRKGGSAKFERTALYRKVFAVAEQKAGKPLPRALIPDIDLASPKITRKLTTEWFATRVDKRYRTCMARAAAR